MPIAKEIEKDAKQFMQNNPLEQDKIGKLLKNEADFFIYFLNCVKENRPLIVSYILNFCFKDATARANFGNKQDKEGNSAYHYAAEKGYDDIIIVLNDKRKFFNEAKFFSFILENMQGKKPLELCCEQSNLSTFKLIWSRAGKNNHNPMYALNSACIGGNIEIINHFLVHPKFDPTEAKIAPIYNAAQEGKFGEEVKQIFLEKSVSKVETNKTKHKITDGLKQNNLFAEMEQKQPINKKQRLTKKIENSTSETSTIAVKSPSLP